VVLGVSIFYGIAAGMSLPEIVDSINGGFGKILSSIGLVIVIGADIGLVMLGGLLVGVLSLIFGIIYSKKIAS
jgi:GntP family gluconate:H+ symporter